MALSSIIIEGNNIAPSVINGGNGPVLKTYAGGLSISGDANISNNSISGIRAGGNHIALLSGSSIVSNNYFARGTTSIGAYISVASTADQIITNNTFDSSTIDGSSEALVTGLSVGSIYDRNKNQTKYLNYHLRGAKYTAPADNTNFAAPNNYSLADTAPGDIGYFGTKGNFYTNTAGSLTFSFYVNMNTILPPGATLLGTTLAATMTSANTNWNASGTNNVSIQAIRINQSLASVNSSGNFNVSGSVLDSPSTVNLTDAVSTFIVKNNFPVTSTDYTINNNELYLNIAVNLTTIATPSSTSKYSLSPLSIKYRY